MSNLKHLSEPSASLDQTGQEGHAQIVSFDNPSDYATSIRATALVFEDPKSRALQERIKRLAPSDASILIMGETGTGKELVARQLHRLSPRANGPFIAVNCAALPENLVESELFGHEKGAFTGALFQKKGWFEAAHGGTLFLDEVGDLPLATQVKLLRVIQEREFSRLGGRATVPVDIRLVAATNVNLAEAVRSGRFREDLYYRLDVAQVRLTPLRERPTDILPLADHFIGLYQNRLHLHGVRLSAEARQALLAYPWPGNIRELENAIHRALLVLSDGLIRLEDLRLSNFQLVDAPARQAEAFFPEQAPLPQPNASPVRPQQEDRAAILDEAFLELYRRGGDNLYAEIERSAISNAYAYCQQNQMRTSELLGITRNILRHRLKLYGLR